MNLLTLFAVLGFAAPKDQGFAWYDPNHLLAGPWLIVLVLTTIAVLLIMPRSSARPLELARELFLVIPAVVLYRVVRGLIEGREDEAVARAQHVVHLERVVRIFWEPSIQHSFMDVRPLMNFMNFTYVLGMWPVIALIGVWLFLQHRDAYPLYRNAFLISGCIGLVIYATLPVAPPRFLGQLGFDDTVAIATGGYGMPSGGLAVNAYAAMPSLHFGWILLCGIAVVHRSNGIGWKLLGIYLPIGMLFAIISTGNHFILDAAAGATVALVGLGASYSFGRVANAVELVDNVPLVSALVSNRSPAETTTGRRDSR